MTTLSKADWRARLRALRAGADDASRQQAAEAIARVGLDWMSTLSASSTAAAAGGVVCAYTSMGTEPQTLELLAALHSAGYSVHVPVCEPGYQLGWARWFTGVGMVRSRFAPVMEPVGGRSSFAQLGPVLAVLVPALAVDRSGTRMGQGGGYYDRFLAGIGPAGAAASVPVAAASVPVAAVVHEHEVLAAGLLPRDALDMPVGFAITPAGMQPLGTTAAH